MNTLCYFFEFFFLARNPVLYCYPVSSFLIIFFFLFTFLQKRGMEDEDTDADSEILYSQRRKVARRVQYLESFEAPPIEANELDNDIRKVVVKEWMDIG